MTERSPFGAWLKQRRHLLDVTQAELGELAGCSEVTVRKLEAGERRPSAALARSLARVLRVPDREADAFVQFARSTELDASFRLPAWNPEQTTDWRGAQLPGGRSVATDVELPFGVTFTYDLVAAETPRVDTLPDGRMLIVIVATGPVGGDIEGTIEVRLHQVIAPKPAEHGYRQALPMQLAAQFTVVVGDDSIEGVYTGTMTPMVDDDGSGIALVQGTGQVVAVTAGFADHFLEHVFVADEVRMQEGIGTGARGTMRIRRPG